jgi:hypothetical protein
MGERIGLTPGQMAGCMGMGALLWLAAALLLRWLGPMGIYEDPLRILTYLLVIPGTWPFVLLIGRVAQLRRDQMFVGMAVGTMVAVLLDGVALAWFPGLYGDTVEIHAGAGAVILWGGGVGMALGWFRTRRA